MCADSCKGGFSEYKGTFMVTLDKRLEACSEFISGKGIVCDVGTDHAYLPAYLVLNNMCSGAVAGDINEGPLKYAQQTVEKYGLGDRIRLVQTDGLEGISPENISDVVIAGMGGETICEILSKAEWLRKNVNLVLQPMTRAAYLRRWLYRNGFDIKAERAVKHERFVYTVINAVYAGNRFNIGFIAENIGKIDYRSDDGRAYVLKQYDKIGNIALGLSKAGKNGEAELFIRSAEKLRHILEGKMNTISEIYDYIDNIAPFASQSGWDNSGLIVGSREKRVSRVLVTLDITEEVADEAADIGAELVISHHPVIFHPLKTLKDDEPSFRLLKNGISAICVHTPWDMAEGGMNDTIINMLGFEKTDGLLETVCGGEKPVGFGAFCIADREYTPAEMAFKLRDALGCNSLKFNNTEMPIRKLAVCTGSGGDFVAKAKEVGADGYVTAEIHHDKWLLAQRLGIAVFDCGHYHTENPGMFTLCRMLSADFPEIEFVMSEKNGDPVEYV